MTSVPVLLFKVRYMFNKHKLFFAVKACLCALSESLDGYARRKGLTINTTKSKVVRFNSHGCNVPAFSVGGSQLANKDSFEY